MRDDQADDKADDQAVMATVEAAMVAEGRAVRNGTLEWQRARDSERR